jgi:hypothetical protein
VINEYLSHNLFEYKKEIFLSEIYRLNKEETRKSCLEEKLHFSYLEVYLRRIGVKFFLTEEKYINRDYLTNYSHYYSTCFSDFSKKSSRIHFFRYDNERNIDEFKNALSDSLLPKRDSIIDPAEFFGKYYAGYIVINPIPNTFLGCTLLKHYDSFEDSKKDGRKFWGIKDYSIHFFGLKINVNSLAFHEQDSNVGACATSAIWAVLQKAAESNNYVNLKSQIEITKNAGITGYRGQRILPNHGLDPKSICEAITKNHLETEIRDFDEIEESQKYLRRIVAAYSSVGIPVILGIDVPDKEGRFAGHAVAICGHYKEQIKPVSGNRTDDIVCKADFITKIYYHDDQWGPFVRGRFPVDLKEDTVATNIYKKQYGVDFDAVKDRFIDSTWTEINTEQEEYKYTYSLEKNEIEELLKEGKKKLYATLLFAIVPVFPKVRINYDEIEPLIWGIHCFLKDIIKFENENVWNYCTWDINLKYSSDFKNEIRNDKLYDFISEQDCRNFKFTILSQSLPKYIWVATIYFDDENKFMTFIFDATGLVNAPLLLHVLFYIPGFKVNFMDSLMKMQQNNSNGALFIQVHNELIDGLSKDYFFI